MRPIFSFCGSLTDKLSKILTKILNPVTVNAPQKLTSTLMVNDAVSDIVVPEDYTMASFDVKSLFTLRFTLTFKIVYPKIYLS